MKPWLDQYPEGVPAEIDPGRYTSLVALLHECFDLYADRVACRFMGKSWRYRDIDQQSRALADALRDMGLTPGDHVALMMPNLPQYPVAVAALLRAGLVLVNVNPQYTADELTHELNDSGAQAIIVLENFAATLQKCIVQTSIQHTIVTTVGDAFGGAKGHVVNWVLRHVKKSVPAHQLQADRWHQLLRTGAGQATPDFHAQPDDLAVLQYTGGTTGVAKGAMLTHRNLIANVLQSEAWFAPAMQTIDPSQQPTFVGALPLYHIFSFTICMMLTMKIGGKLILIADPRQIDALLKGLSRETFHCFPAVNTLFNAIAHHSHFERVDWSHLRVSVGGGMAVQKAVAKLWLEKTGCPVCEGYGLSETSPSASCNVVTSKTFTGTIGLPLPSTELSILDDHDRPVPFGTSGEIAVRGPQVMAGYWQRPDETAKVMTADGFFKTGDIGIMDEQGYTRVIDRKKDMILVSGFNVYPNDVEDTIAAMPGVLEVAVIGVPDAHSGETVKAVVVRQDNHITEQDVRAWCREHLTGYKRPHHIEFRDALPKTNVGKVLRRALRDETTAP